MSEVRYSRGESDERPWGRWEVLETGEGFIVKRITVRPGEILSLQRHRYRSEHWVIVAGVAEVTLDEQITRHEAGAHIHVPLGCWHRAHNPGDTIMEFIEVQQGEVLDENDIERREDSYGRL